MIFASTEKFQMERVLFHFLDKSFISISWASESLLTAVASKQQFKNPRLLKDREGSGPVL